MPFRGQGTIETQYRGCKNLAKTVQGSFSDFLLNPKLPGIRGAIDPGFLHMEVHKVLRAWQAHGTPYCMLEHTETAIEQTDSIAFTMLSFTCSLFPNYCQFEGFSEK